MVWAAFHSVVFKILSKLMEIGMYSQITYNTQWKICYVQAGTSKLLEQCGITLTENGRKGRQTLICLRFCISMYAFMYFNTLLHPYCFFSLAEYKRRVVQALDMRLRNIAAIIPAGSSMTWVHRFLSFCFVVRDVPITHSANYMTWICISLFTEAKKKKEKEKQHTKGHVPFSLQISCDCM